LRLHRSLSQAILRNHSIGTSRNFIDPTLRIQISVVLNEYATFSCSHTVRQRRVTLTVLRLRLTLGIRVGAHPPVISWMTDVVGMIVDSGTTLMVHIPWFDRHQVPVVVIGK
jgi:hypothetical protein